MRALRSGCRAGTRVASCVTRWSVGWFVCVLCKPRCCFSLWCRFPRSWLRSSLQRWSVFASCQREASKRRRVAALHWRRATCRKVWLALQLPRALRMIRGSHALLAATFRARSLCERAWSALVSVVAYRVARRKRNLWAVSVGRLASMQRVFCAWRRRHSQLHACRVLRRCVPCFACGVGVTRSRCVVAVRTEPLRTDA